MADPKLRKLRDPATARYLENIVNSTKEILKLESGGMQMIPDRVYVEPEQLDAASYNKTKVSGRTWKTPMYADISLKDSNTGKLIQKKEKMLIGYIPDITPVGSFLIQGSEYYVPTQFRIKPGVYTRERNDGLLESWFNTAKGRSMKILFDSDKEDFKINIAGKTIPLFPILQATAKSENQLRGWFGDRLAIKLAKKYKSNAKKISALNKMNIAITGEEQTDPVIAAENIKKYWEDRPGALDPASVKESLGVDADRVSPEIIGKSVNHILKVFKGEDKVDDRDNLAFKQALTYENLIPMRLSNPSIVRNIQYKIKYRLAKKGNIRESIPVGVITQPITDFFLVNGGSLAVSSDQTNVLSMYNTTKKSTILGEGSISSTDAIVAGARDLHPTKMGIIDPVFTPESDKVGVVEHLARGVVYDHKNNVLKTRVWDRKENKEVLVEPSRALNDGMAIRDQFVKKNGKFSPKDKLIWGYIGGDIGRTAEEKIRYIFHKPENMFSQTTNMVPFLTSNSGPRLMMASKMMEQAVPLIREERESPLVEAVTEEGKSFAEEIIYPKDREALVSISPGDGVIESVSENFISVKTKKGVEKVSTYKNHPLTAKTFLSSEPIVKKGQKVKKGELLADINFTKDGKLAIGKNLTTAYMPYMGYTLDDAIVISEAAAKKLTSEHLYKITIPIDRNTILSKDKFRSAFPGIIEDKESKKYDEDGIIREGQTIDEADQISLTVRKLTPGPVSDIYTRLRKRKDSFIDSSISWDKPMSGEIVKVNKTPNSVEVHVKTTEPMEVGDKLSNFHGGKGIVSAIIPNKDMPKRKDGSVIDVIFDPVSVPGRSNPGQIFETAAAKIAEHDGKVYQVYNFEEGKNHHKKLTEELRDRGISDKEELFGPDGKSLGNIATGPQYIIKLQHRVASKMSARERAGYDVDQNPLHGGTEVGKAKGVDRMILYSLLASGAKANLQEMSILKGTRNEEYWRALESGDPLPSLKVPFAMEKMMSYLKAAGINVSKEGSSLKLLPITDKDILSLSAGKISRPQMIRAKDLKEEPGGLFDPVITGGLEGKRYSHMTLPEPMPNPIFEKAIASVLNIREKDVGEIISGRSGIDKNGNITKDPNENEIGGKAIHMALNSLNVKKELKSTKERLDEIDINEQPDLVNKLNRRARYLRNLSELNIPPSNAYIMNHIPVIPPVFRPIYPLPSGDLETADLNYLYRDIGIMSIQLEKASILTLSDRNSVRSGLYDAIKAYSGITSPKYGRPFKGVIEYLAGKGSPKTGFFQRKVLRKEQDISGRSVVTPNPELGPDEIEIPKDMAWKLYRPLMLRRLVDQGLNPSEAIEEIEEESPGALRSLDITMSKHPIFLNRAPTLHKFSIMAFRPKMWPGKTIRVPHLVAKGLSMDFDGDELSVFVPITPKAAKEASSLMPTANLFNPGSMDIMLAPAQSTIHGLYHATTPSGPFKGSFDTSLDVQSSVDSGAISINDRINFKGQKTTPGSVLINERLPKNLQNYQTPLNINRVKEILRDLADKNTSDYGRVVSEMKSLGDRWATGSGLTIGMDDLTPIYEKNKIIDSAISKSKNSAAAIDQRASVDRELKGILNRIKSESSIVKMLNSGAISKGKYSQIKQILMSPVMAQNYRRTPIPVLIKSSYSEGLSPTEYWAASFGARAGMMDRALSTSLPGAFAKEVLAASVSLTITINDCRTSKGKNISVSDPFASGRLLAKSAGEFPANTIVDGNILRNLKSQNIKYVVVRSPSTCEAKKGICQKCYGLSESGSYYEIGENIGSISGTSITEPITQMAMTGFHTSGVVEGGGGVLTGSPRIFQLLRLPTFVAGAAVLSRKSGKVDSVSETEAGRVKIDISGSPHFVQPGIALKVKKGDRISKGQPITGGLVNPRDIIIIKGIEAFRGFLSDELRKTYKEQNKDIDPRHFDVISRIVSSHARVDESGSSDFIKGDIVPIDEIELLNKDLKNKIEYEPYLRGVNTAPLASSDWLARMGYQQIRKTIQEGAASGWSSEVGEMGHPIASYVFGTEFFKGDSPALKRLNNAWVDLKSV